MPAGRGIAAFNGLHAGGNESFEEQMDFFVQIGVFDGNADLVAQRDKGVQVFLAEWDAMFLVDRLEHAEQAPVRRHGYTDHVAGDKPTDLIYMTEESRIALHVIHNDRFSASCHVSRDSLAPSEPGFAYSLSLFAMRHIEVQFSARFVQEEQRPGFSVHQQGGRFDGPGADGGMIETGVEQGAQVLKLSQGWIRHRETGRPD